MLLKQGYKCPQDLGITCMWGLCRRPGIYIIQKASSPSSREALQGLLGPPLNLASRYVSSISLNLHSITSSQFRFTSFLASPAGIISSYFYSPSSIYTSNSWRMLGSVALQIFVASLRDRGVWLRPWWCRVPLPLPGSLINPKNIRLITLASHLCNWSTFSLVVSSIEIW